MVLDSSRRANFAAMVGMARKTGHSLWYLGGKGVAKVSEMLNGRARSASDSRRHEQDMPAHPLMMSDDQQAGVVKVVDLGAAVAPSAAAATVAHFRAHLGSPVAIMAFDPTGTLLVTASTDGLVFHVFHLGAESYPLKAQPSHSRTPSDSNGHAALATANGGGGEDRAGGPAEPSPAAVNYRIAAQHIYSLQRGITTASICSISFSMDSRWVALASDRGTTHVFPINPRGEPITTRTHTAPTVTNPSRFETSAGISEMVQKKKDGREPIEVSAILKLKYPAAGAPADEEDERRGSHRSGPPAARTTAPMLHVCFVFGDIFFFFFLSDPFAQTPLLLSPPVCDWTRVGLLWGDGDGSSQQPQPARAGVERHDRRQRRADQSVGGHALGHAGRAQDAGLWPG